MLKMKLNKTHSKKTMALLTAAVLTVGTLTAAGIALPQYVSAVEAPAVTEVTATLSPDISVTLDGTVCTFFDVTGQRVYPVLYNGTNYLPVRAIGELMGKNVNWDQSTLTISLTSPRTTAAATGEIGAVPEPQDVVVSIRPDFTILVDGSERQFQDEQGHQVYPLLRDGTTYLPVRAIGQLMGKSVSWDSATKTVVLKEPQPQDSLVTDADTFGQTNPGTSSQSSPSADPNVQDGLIGVNAAKEKALAHAGLTEAQVTFSRAYLEWDDGRRVYDIEFYANNGKEYDYVIDAATGGILEFDYDTDHHSASGANGGSHQSVSGSDQQTYIGIDEARSIALAQVPGATANNVRKLKLDSDDGRRVYECEIVYGNCEYEFEIDAVTGQILSSDRDFD